MLLKKEKDYLKKILGDIKESPIDLSDARLYYKAQRKIIHMYEDVVLRAHSKKLKLSGADFERLRCLAGEAIQKIGGQSEPSPVSLKQYDHTRYGPFLGVSDEGSAAESIRDAALDSPKIGFIDKADPIQTGVALDAERLAAVGEVAVGPDEYKEIRLECMGRILNSTNVGTRLNLRYFKKRPVIEISRGPLDVVAEDAIKKGEAFILPFWKTPDNQPRPLVVFVEFTTVRSRSDRLKILRILNRAVNSGEFCDPGFHKLGLLVRSPAGNKGVLRLKNEIDLAKRAGLSEVAVKGHVREEAENKISLPGLLIYFSPIHASKLIRYAASKNIHLSPRNLVDPETVARNVWCGLNAARNMGFELGKYGLFPLTLEENNTVMGMIQSWFDDWTAAPAIYVDFPIVGKTDVYWDKTITKGLEECLRIVADREIPVVLIDTADKDKGKRILKSGKNDRQGILTLDQISHIDCFGMDRGVRILWAGGISLPQAYDFGKLGVFGIYVTSAASIARPVTHSYAADIMLAQEKEPTYEGVSRVKLLLEAGFLYSGLLKHGYKTEAGTLNSSVKEFINSLRYAASRETVKESKKDLHSKVRQAWWVHMKNNK